MTNHLGAFVSFRGATAFIRWLRTEAPRRLRLLERDYWSIRLAMLLRLAYLFEIGGRYLRTAPVGDGLIDSLWLIGTFGFAVYIAVQLVALLGPDEQQRAGSIPTSIGIDLAFFTFFFAFSGQPDSTLIFAILLPLITAALYLRLRFALLTLGAAIVLMLTGLLVIGVRAGPGDPAAVAQWFGTVGPAMPNAPAWIAFVNSVLFCLVTLPLVRRRVQRDEARAISERYRDLLRLLADRSRDFARGGDIEALVAIALEAAREDLRCETVDLFIYKSRSGRFEHVRALGSRDDQALVEHYAAGEGLTGRAALPEEGGRSIRVDDLAEHFRLHGDPLAEHQHRFPSGVVRHLIAVPLNGPNRIFGVLRAVNKLAPQTSFGEHDGDILATLAMLVALAYSAARRTEKERAVFNLYQKLTDTLNLEQVCRRLAAAIVEIGYSAGCVLLRDHPGALRVQALEGMTPEAAALLGQLAAIERHRLAALSGKQQSHQAGIDAGTHPALSGYLRDHGLGTALRLPLRHGAEVLGLLEIYVADGYQFSLEEIETLHLIAAQATAAVVNAKTTERDRQQIHSLTRLNELIAQIAAYDDEERLFADVAHSAAALLDAEDCSIFWINRDEGTVTLRASNRLPRAVFRNPTPVRRGERAGLVSYVAATGETLRFLGDDYRAHYAWSGAFLSHLDHLPSRRCASLLIQPILNEGGAPVGVIKAENKLGIAGAAGFTLSDVKLIDLVSKQIAQTADRIHRIRKLRHLQEIAQQITEMGEPAEVLPRIAAVARAVVPADQVVICTYSREKGALDGATAIVSGDPLSACLHDRIEGDALLSALVAGKTSVAVLEGPPGSGVTSAIAVVLRNQDLPVVVMLFDFRSRRDATTEELADAETFGKLAGVAVQNAMLYGTATRVNCELEAMQILTNTVLDDGDLSLEALLDVVLSSICDVLGYEFCTVSLIDATERLVICERACGIAISWQAESRHPLSSYDIQAEIIRTGATRVIRGWDEHFDPEIYWRHGHDQLVRVFTPIGGRSRIIGTIEAGHQITRRATISEDEVNTLRRYVGQVALVIDSLRELELSRAHARQLKQLHSLSQQMLAIRPQEGTDHMLECAATVVAAILGPDALVRLQLGASSQGPRVTWAGGAAPALANAALAAVVDQTMREVQPHDLSGPYEPGRGVPLLCVPLHIGSETLGCICLLYQRDHWFSEGERELLAVCAAHVATALVNGRSHADLAASRDWLFGNMEQIYHDLLGSNLTSASRALELAAHRYGPVPPQQLRWIETGRHELEEATERIENWLALRKYGPDSLQFHTERQKTRMPVADLVRDSVRRFEQQAAEKNILVGVGIATDCVALQLSFHAERITSALDNLISNAVKFTPAGGRVDVQLRREDARLLIHVDDTGPGVPAEYHERIFDQFFQIPSDQLAQQKGVGLGLSCAKLFIRMHGGDIVVRNLPQRGARFTVSLPIPSDVLATLNLALEEPEQPTEAVV